jgi:hypothetical protein
MNKLVYGLLCSSLLLFSCSKKPSATAVTAEEQFMADIAWEPLPFSYLVFKSKFNYKEKNSTVSGSANIRMKKDSIIWMSVSPGLGIEAVRIKITPDSVQILNRLQNKYDHFHISEIKSQLGIDVDFKGLQNLLIGDILYPIQRNDNIKMLEHEVQLKQARGNLNITQLVLKSNHKVGYTEVLSNDGKTLKNTYNTFAVVDSNTIANSFSAIAINQADTLNIDVNHQKIEFPTKNVAFPFTVPKKYEK